MDYPVITAEGISSQVAASTAPTNTATDNQPAAQMPAGPAGQEQAQAPAGQEQAAQQAAASSAQAQQPAQQTGQSQPATQPTQQPVQQAGQSQQAQQQPGQQAAGQQQAGSLLNPDDQPLQEWDNFDLGVAAEKVDAAMVASFGKQAVALGLTPRQARALAQWQTEIMEAGRAEKYKAEEAKLAAVWGKDSQANASKVAAFAAQLDRQPGLEGFSQALVESGAASNALVVRGLYAIAQSLGEDRAGAVGMGQPAAETALDGIRAAFARARARRPE